MTLEQRELHERKTGIFVRVIIEVTPHLRQTYWLVT